MTHKFPQQSLVVKPPPPPMPKGRRCANQQCRAPMSRYNTEDECFACRKREEDAAKQAREIERAREAS